MREELLKIMIFFSTCKNSNMSAMVQSQEGNKSQTLMLSICHFHSASCRIWFTLTSTGSPQYTILPLNIAQLFIYFIWRKAQFERNESDLFPCQCSQFTQVYLNDFWYHHMGYIEVFMILKSNFNWLQDLAICSYLPNTALTQKRLLLHVHSTLRRGFWA